MNTEYSASDFESTCLCDDDDDNCYECSCSTEKECNEVENVMTCILEEDNSACMEVFAAMNCHSCGSTGRNNETIVEILTSYNMQLLQLQTTSCVSAMVDLNTALGVLAPVG